jgi:hypothetical protein
VPKDVIKPALPAQAHAPIAIQFALGVSVLIVIPVISVAAYAGHGVTFAML